MNRQGERMPVDEGEPFLSRQDVERSVDGQRYYGQLQLVGQCEGSLLEFSHMPSEGTGSLRENGDAIALLKNLAGCLVGLLNLLGTPFVDHNLV